MFVGFIVGGTAKSNTALLAAMSLIGFVSTHSTLFIIILTESCIIGWWKCSSKASTYPYYSYKSTI